MFHLLVKTVTILNTFHTWRYYQKFCFRTLHSIHIRVQSKILRVSDCGTVLASSLSNTFAPLLLSNYTPKTKLDEETQHFIALNRKGILAYAIKLNFRFIFLLAFMRVISWNDAPWFSSVSQSLSETNQTVFFLRTDQTKCIFDPSPGLCIFQGILDCQEIQYVGSYHNIIFLWKVIAGTYTEQNYKCTTFIFTPIFHELNSKI